MPRRSPIETDLSADKAFFKDSAWTPAASLLIMMRAAERPDPFPVERALTVPPEIVISPLSAWIHARVKGAAVFTVRVPEPSRVRELFSQTIPLTSSLSEMVQLPENAIVRVLEPL